MDEILHTPRGVVFGHPAAPGPTPGQMGGSGTAALAQRT